MFANSSFRIAMEAVGHIGDSSPPWADILESAKEVVGADAATLIMFNGQQDLLLLRQTGMDAAAEDEYSRHYYQQDAIAHSALNSAAGVWWDSSRLQSAPGASRLPFYADYMPRHKLAQVLAFVVIGEPERRAAISFQRMTADSNALEKFGQGNVARYVRALSTAIALRERNSAHEYASLEAALSGTGEAVFIAGTNGKLYRYSLRAHEMLREARMLARHDLTLTHPDEKVLRGFYAALTRSSVTQQCRRFAISTSWGCGMRLDIIPAPARMKLANEPALLVRMRKSSIFTVPDVNELAAFFSITISEAKTLAALIEGHSPQEYALSQGVAERTVRNHIASLMKKMSCNRQAELVRHGSLLR